MSVDRNDRGLTDRNDRGLTDRNARGPTDRNARSADGSIDATATPVDIRPARSAADLQACFPVMLELRPHLTSAAELVARVQDQAEQGYRLLAAWSGPTVVGAAGYRMQQNLIRGRFCYVDDLVVAQSERRGGLGARLLDSVAAEARAMGCPWLMLDTAVNNLLGQRFYFRYGMLPAALHFAKALD